MIQLEHVLTAGEDDDGRIILTPDAAAPPFISSSTKPRLLIQRSLPSGLHEMKFNQYDNPESSVSLREQSGQTLIAEQALKECQQEESTDQQSFPQPPPSPVQRATTASGTTQHPQEQKLKRAVQFPESACHDVIVVENFRWGLSRKEATRYWYKAMEYEFLKQDKRRAEKWLAEGNPLEDDMDMAVGIDIPKVGLQKFKAAQRSVRKVLAEQLRIKERPDEEKDENEDAVTMDRKLRQKYMEASFTSHMEAQQRGFELSQVVRSYSSPSPSGGRLSLALPSEILSQEVTVTFLSEHQKGPHNRSRDSLQRRLGRRRSVDTSYFDSKSQGEENGPSFVPKPESPKQREASMLDIHSSVPTSSSRTLLQEGIPTHTSSMGSSPASKPARRRTNRRHSMDFKPSLPGRSSTPPRTYDEANADDSPMMATTPNHPSQRVNRRRRHSMGGSTPIAPVRSSSDRESSDVPTTTTTTTTTTTEEDISKYGYEPTYSPGDKYGFDTSRTPASYDRTSRRRTGRRHSMDHHHCPSQSRFEPSSTSAPTPTRRRSSMDLAPKTPLRTSHSNNSDTPSVKLGGASDDNITKLVAMQQQQAGRNTELSIVESIDRAMEVTKGNLDELGNSRDRLGGFVSLNSSETNVTALLSLERKNKPEQTRNAPKKKRSSLKKLFKGMRTK